MDKNAVLLRRLRNLSPLMSGLVDVVEKEKITVMTSESCRAYMKSINRKDLILIAGFDNIATRDCSDVGLGKVIILRPAFLSKMIREGNLGYLEFGFAHEIGHNLTRNLTPFCYDKYICEYLEVVAYKAAVDIIRKLNRRKGLKFMHLGKFLVFKDFLRAGAYFSAETGARYYCISSLKPKNGCPKQEEGERITKEILESEL